MIVLIVAVTEGITDYICYVAHTLRRRKYNITAVRTLFVSIVPFRVVIYGLLWKVVRTVSRVMVE